MSSAHSPPRTGRRKVEARQRPTSGTSKGEKVMIMKCTCKHEYQDKKYGVGSRVHNALAPKPGGPQKYRCTVCGTVRDAFGKIVIAARATPEAAVKGTKA